jgi:hypothetical protein
MEPLDKILIGKRSTSSLNLVKTFLLCIFILLISSICFFVAIFYQLWTSHNFWEYLPILGFPVAGVIGYVLVIWLIFKAISDIGSDVVYNWTFIGFLIIFLNVVVYAVPGFGVNIVGVIIGELIVGVIAFLAHETYTKKRAIKVK